MHYGRPEVVPMRWGLVTASSKKTATETRVFNARAESVADNPMFQPTFKRSRCIIPAAGYYEWKTINGAKQPFYFSAADGSILSIAGLWDGCTLIVTLANDFAARIHPNMPLFLQPNNFVSGLAGSGGTELLMPAPNDSLRVRRVSKRVNCPGTDKDISLIEAVTSNG